MSKINSRELPEWLNNFVAFLDKDPKKTVIASEKTAEVNVKDLPKVVWNDETFYAMFDEAGATVLNEFGNTVTSIKGAGDIEAVDKHLNSKQVVTSEVKQSSVLDEELKKVATYLADVEATEQNPYATPPQENGTPDPNAQQNTQVTPPVQDGTQPVQPVDQTTQDVNGLEQDVDNTTASINMMARFADMETTMQDMQSKIMELTEQVRAYQDPGNVYDLNVTQLEQQHFEESAAESAKQIELEHNIDLTTMQGRISLVDQLNNDIDTIMNTDDSELEISEEELSEIEEVQDNYDKQCEDENCDCEDVLENGDTLIEIELPEAEEITDVPEEDTEVLDIDAPAEEVSEETDEPKDEKKDIQVNTKLSSKDAKIFKQKICVACGEKNLVKANTVANMVGIYCKSCTAEYGVDTNTESIYKRV